MLCFEVTINDGPPVLAGLDEISVLVATTTYVARRAELEFSLGGLISRSASDNEHVDWVQQSLRPGDTVVLRLVESEEATEPASRVREDPDFVEKQRRRYYEKLREEYEGKKG